MPFVMGTTGGDPVKVAAVAEAAGVYAVVSPQMGKQVGLLARGHACTRQRAADRASLLNRLLHTRQAPDASSRLLLM